MTTWWLELPGSGAASLNFSSRAEAMDAARARDPEWVEVGEIIPAGRTTPRHHRWTTLRRDASGAYRPSVLGWAGRKPDHGAAG
jgi:hypothetical protein